MRRLALLAVCLLLALPAWAASVNEINWTPYETPVTYETTDLNTLADQSNELGDAITNSDGETHIDIMVFLDGDIGSARSVDAVVLIYILPRVDGTNYPTGADGTGIDPNQSPSCVMKLDASITARYEACRGLAAPPGLFKMLLSNETGQAFKATGNIWTYALYSLEVNVP